MEKEKISVKGREYNILPPQHVTSQLQVIVNPCCNSWLVENDGDVIAYVNNKPIKPPPTPALTGQSYGIEADEGDIYIGRIDISFAAGGTNPSVWVTQVVYTDRI